MSGHEQERLSAFLDGELAPGERAAVEAHLAACAECAARLAELAAVDRAVAEQSPEAPPGYFDALPGRVRARLEPRDARRRLPAWTWAAAAALLLAIVTPLTLRHAPAPAGRTVPAAAPPAPLTQMAPAAGAPAREAEPAAVESKADADRREQPMPAPTVRTRPQATGFAAAPREEAPRQPVQAQAPAAPAPAPAAPAAAPTAARQANVASRESEGGALAMAETAPPSKDEEAEVQGGRSDAADRLHAVPESAGLAADVAKSRKLTGAAEFDRLAAARPQTAAEWRRLREEWRGFVERDPRGPQADEARVRAVEAGYEAWRASGDSADARGFRADASAYLARDDAGQKERVRRLLR